MTDIVRADPFAVALLTDEERQDELVTEIFSDGRRRSIDFGDFRPATFKKAVASVELEYRRLGRVPTVDEVHDSWSAISLQTYGELYASRPFRDALRRRGIVLTDEKMLSQDQLAALALLTDISDRRTNGAKMAALGLNTGVLSAWMRNPVFREERSRRAREITEDSVASARERLAANVDAGDQRAIEFTMAMTGVYSPALAANQDAMKVVYAVLEAVQKHVPDPEVLRSILGEVQVAAKGFDIATGAA